MPILKKLKLRSNEVVQYLLQMLYAAIIVTIIFLPFVEGGQLISPRQMERLGLVRVWYNQLAVDTNMVRLQHVTIEGDTLFAVSSDSKIHAINALTGKLIWSHTMGKRELQYQTPAANSRVVAVVNNIELFVYDRKTGKLLLYTPLPNSVAVTACEVSENYVYIPMLGGRVIVYPIEVGVEEKILNIKTGEYEDAHPVTSKPPIPANQSDIHIHTHEQHTTPQSDKTKKNISAMKVVVDGDLAERDKVVAEIVESFAQTKHAIFAKPEIPPKEPQLTLQPPLNFPMSTITFGDMMIQPRITSQVIKIDPANNSLKMHWEILTWINKDGDFHSAIIRDLSKTKIDQLYKVSSPTKIFKPETNQISEREWKIGKQVVIRPTTSQTVPYFYSGINFEQRMVPDLSVLGTKSGYVYAIKNRNGEIAWHFISNGPVTEQIGIIGVDVFVPTQYGMYNIDLLAGKEKWYAPNIQKFLCASKVRVYVKDKHGFLVILDRRSGSRIALLDLRKFREVLFNIETDRLFIVDDSGLIQCFAERQADTVSNIIRSGVRPIPEIRHRLSASQYADAVSGKKIPDLYWVEALGMTGKSIKVDSVNTENVGDEENTGTSETKGNVDQTASDSNTSQTSESPPPPTTTTESTQPDSQNNSDMTTTQDTTSADSTSTTDSENSESPSSANPTSPEPANPNPPPADNTPSPDPKPDEPEPITIA